MCLLDFNNEAAIRDTDFDLGARRETGLRQQGAGQPEGRLALLNAVPDAALSCPSWSASCRYPPTAHTDTDAERCEAGVATPGTLVRDPGYGRDSTDLI